MTKWNVSFCHFWLSFSVISAVFEENSFEIVPVFCGNFWGFERDPVCGVLGLKEALYIVRTFICLSMSIWFSRPHINQAEQKKERNIWTRGKRCWLIFWSILGDFRSICPDFRAASTEPTGRFSGPWRRARGEGSQGSRRRSRRAGAWGAHPPGASAPNWIIFVGTKWFWGSFTIWYYFDDR